MTTDYVQPFHKCHNSLISSFSKPINRQTDRQTDTGENDNLLRGGKNKVMSIFGCRQRLFLLRLLISGPGLADRTTANSLRVAYAMNELMI